MYGAYKDENDHNHCLQTFSRDQGELNYSPIYSKPLPKNQRTRQDPDYSPIKSILKKRREEGDGEADPGEGEEQQYSTLRRKQPPPTLPKPPPTVPLLMLDVTQHSSPDPSLRHNVIIYV